ncbi:hypothetical protein [Algoriphagus aquimarinus]|uniref:hypothetical protein n=1 Tax=Algoriphagus aquimarinus TaxID=237018 RepID=UPI0030D77050
MQQELHPNLEDTEELLHILTLLLSLLLGDSSAKILPEMEFELVCGHTKCL